MEEFPWRIYRYLQNIIHSPRTGRDEEAISSLDAVISISGGTLTGRKKNAACLDNLQKNHDYIKYANIERKKRDRFAVTNLAKQASRGLKTA